MKQLKTMTLKKPYKKPMTLAIGVEPQRMLDVSGGPGAGDITPPDVNDDGSGTEENNDNEQTTPAKQDYWASIWE